MKPGELREITDFWPARIIISAVELEFFPVLMKSATASEVADECGTEPKATRMLLDALTALGALTLKEDHYAVHPDLAGSFAPTGPCLTHYIMHRSQLWRSWSELSDIVRFGQGMAKPWEKGEVDGASLTSFIGAMAVCGQESAAEAIAALDLSGVKRVLDIGGGPGTYAAAFCAAEPGLSVTVLDHPEVCSIARHNLQDTPYTTRVGFAEGDALKITDAAVRADNGGYDLVFTSNLIHSMGPDEVQELMRRTARWVRPGGLVVVKDFFLDETRSSPPRAAIFAINMLVNTSEGRSYTWDEVSGWLAGATQEQHHGPGPIPSMDIERKPLPNGASGMLIARIGK